MLSTQYVISFSLLLFLPILILLAPHILPHSHPSLPISPQDELHDLSLFNRALSLSQPKPNPKEKPSRIFLLSTSQKPTLKIAFLFLTNTNLHFSPLWNLFFHSTNPNLFNIYVHAYPSLNLTALPLNDVFRGRFIPSKPTSRASPTLISATRRLLATALLDDPVNAYFALLSQHCIPLHSFRYVYRSLFLSPTFDSSESTRRVGDKSFIEILASEPELWKRYTARGRFAMMPEVPFEQFRVGSQFFALTRRHAPPRAHGDQGSSLLGEI